MIRLPTLDRRAFMKWLPALSATAAAAGTLPLTACASARYLEARPDGERLRVRRADFAGFACERTSRMAAWE